MKQNPSRPQASISYLDTLRSEFDALTQQLQEQKPPPAPRSRKPMPNAVPITNSKSARIPHTGR